MSKPNSNLTNRTNADPQADQDLLQLVGFVIGAEEYAISIEAVQEINRTVLVTPVPQCPPFVEGVFNLRGKPIPVIDLRKRFGKPVNDITSDQRVIVAEVQAGQETYVLGLTVDKVNRVLRIANDTLEPAPADDTGSAYVQSIGQLDEGPLSILSLDKLFSPTELRLAASACLAADAASHAA